jgi:hypothetical protein
MDLRKPERSEDSTQVQTSPHAEKKADWTSIHLDVISQDRGLKRLAASLYKLQPRPILINAFQFPPPRVANPAQPARR